MKDQFFTYILRCKDNTLYTGYAGDLAGRVDKHNQGKGAKYTRGRLPVELVYFEKYPIKNQAMAREAEIKGMAREDKLALIEGFAKREYEVTAKNNFCGSVAKMKSEFQAGEKIEDNTTTGVLYLCATPLGNLEDITLRALNILRNSDLIAAEDTRRTIKLLNHYQIKTPLTSYHEHNEHHKGEKLLEELLSGKNVALVSDAGMPGISDPGEVIVKKALDKEIRVIPIPGPSAGITALVASGLDTGAFVFDGFLTRNKKERGQQLSRLSEEHRTIILYESPHRLKKALEEIMERLGDRKIVLARELTKVHEEFVRGRISEVLEKLEGGTVRGEFCLIIEGKSKEDQKNNLPLWEGNELLEHVQALVQQGLSKKEAIKEVAGKMGKSKREVYNDIIQLENRG